MTPPSTLRRLGIALAGLAVAGLTAVACVLSFDDLRALAIRGESRPDLAFLYPAGFDALLVVALIGVLLLRSAHLLVRAQAAVVLVLLIVAAAASNVAPALQVQLDVQPLAVGVALAPWVMLALALWLWLLLIKHVQGRRTSMDDDDDGTAEQDIVPFHRGRPADTPPPLTQPLHPVLETTPVVGPTAAPETPPISAQVTRWPATPDQEPEFEDRRDREALTEPGAPPRPRQQADDLPPEPDPRAQARKEDDAQRASTASRATAPWQEPEPGSRTEQGARTEPGGRTESGGRTEPSTRTEPGERTEPSGRTGSQVGDAPTRAPKLRRGLRKRAQEPTYEDPRPEPEPRLSREPEPAPETDHQATDHHAAGHSEAAPVAGGESRPDTSREPRPETAARTSQPEPEPELKRPVRWGDRIKPTDVLVHPRTPAVSDRDTDTQPVRVFSDTPDTSARTTQEPASPDPDHGPEAADPAEAATARSLEDRDLEDTAPHPVIEDDAPAPSGRLRSTPLPPEE
ncbi:DUF2637 domain-containing protein [Nonomuraea guangzhouensis]|uniref:DUF2637 domain-containing protein n=1 Tax=Nonomuraea guangzhouensis TaxID=1291555 RepID=A0ABW4G466_9ACTN|nr:DUF2637 domain-containing protein [Nonomuraea guangzhouensis]